MDKKIFALVCAFALIAVAAATPAIGLTLKNDNKTDIENSADKNKDLNENDKELPKIRPLEELSEDLILIEKTDGLEEMEFIEPGEEYNYTINFTNQNPYTVHDVYIFDDLPYELDFVSASNGGRYQSDDHSVYWNDFVELDPNETHEIQLKLKVNESKTNAPVTVINVVNISSVETEKNTAFERTPISYPNPDFDDLLIDKSNNLTDSMVGAGELVNFSICITNPNPLDVYNVDIVDTLADELEFVIGSGNAHYNETRHKVYWNMGVLNSGETKCAWLHARVDAGVEQSTEIENIASVISNQTQESTDSDTIIVKDNTPPTVQKTFYGPTYLNNLWISDNTLISIYAEDPGVYSTGVKNLTVKILKLGIYTKTIFIEDNDANDSSAADGIIEYRFRITDQCRHRIEYTAFDKSGNFATKSQLHLVDTTEPELHASVGNPQDPNYYYLDGQWFTGVSSDTPIHIGSDGDLGCQGGVGIDYLGIEVYRGECYGEWESLYTLEVTDGCPMDKNPRRGEIEVELFMEESCWHQVHYYIEDKLGNRNPNENTVMPIEVIVDADGPISDYWYEGPQYYNGIRWITSDTFKHIQSSDIGCLPGGSGINNIHWWIYKEIEDELIITKEGIVTDNSPDDLNCDSGIIEISVNVSESCNHFISHQAEDNIGNLGSIFKQYVKVDNNPPSSYHIVGNPKCQFEKDDKIIYCVKTTTPIDIYSEDRMDPCAVGLEYFEYQIFDINDYMIVHEMIYDRSHDTFTFEDQGNFTLRYRGIDLLGNVEPWKYQDFTVDNNAPMIIKRVLDPKVRGTPSDPSEPDFYITSDTIIQIDAEYDRGCPFFLIKYRLNEGSWHDITSFIENDMPYNLTLPDECKYTLEIYAEDCNNHITDIERFYVDNTAPYFEIIKPIDDFYYPGQCIFTEIYAEDEAHFVSPCFDDHFVGIGEGSEGEAWIIDILPGLHIVPLETQFLIYDSEQLIYGHKACIPEDCCLNAGPVLFIGGAKDRLGNGAEQIKEEVVDLYYMAGGSSNFDMQYFNSLIEPLLQDKKIVWIAITDDVPSEDFPSVVIMEPQDNSTESGNVNIEILASDLESETSDLDVKVAVYILNYPPRTYDTTFDGTHFNFNFDVSDYRNSKEIQFVAYATDEDENTGVSPPVNIIVSSDVIYDQYLEEGWNPIQIGVLFEETYVESVFSSIMDDVEIIFEEDTWHNYIPNESGNTLLEVDNSKTYWVKLYNSAQYVLR